MFFDVLCECVFFFKQKTAYEMRISDWSSDVCSSDLSADLVGLFRLVRCCGSGSVRDLCGVTRRLDCAQHGALLRGAAQQLDTRPLRRKVDRGGKIGRAHV